MKTTVRRGGHKPASIRTLWAIAKSPELMLSDENLHELVNRETGKDSMKKLTQGEISKLARILQNLKDGVQKTTRNKRTDEGGDPRTVQLRHKIYALCNVLGWNNDNKRINGFAKRVCGVERIEWLTIAQCHKIIEALKGMVARQQQKGADTV
jgi:phage gp16-like protein